MPQFDDGSEYIHYKINQEEEGMKESLSKSKITFSLCLIILTFLIGKLGYSQEVKIDKFPNRPITLIVPWSPGTSADTAFRLLGKEAEKYLGQPVIVINKAGGGGTIGLGAIATAKPDGYTIGHSPGAGSQFVLPFLQNVPYHTVRDFRQIMQFCILNTGVIVKANSPFKSLKDLITYARQNPKKLTYGTNAPNSIGNIIMEQIARREEVQFTHIPFKGSTEYQTALLGGHVLFTVGDINYSLVESGETRILLFLQERFGEYPQIPALKDLGYDINCPNFMGIMGPKDIPDEIAEKIEKAFTDAMKAPAFIKGMKDLRLAIFYRTGKEFEAYVAHTYEVFSKVLEEMGLIK